MGPLHSLLWPPCLMYLLSRNWKLKRFLIQLSAMWSVKEKSNIFAIDWFDQRILSIWNCLWPGVEADRAGSFVGDQCEMHRYVEMIYWAYSQVNFCQVTNCINAIFFTFANRMQNHQPLLVIGMVKWSRNGLPQTDFSTSKIHIHNRMGYDGTRDVVC